VQCATRAAQREAGVPDGQNSRVDTRLHERQAAAMRGSRAARAQLRLGICTGQSFLAFEMYSHQAARKTEPARLCSTR
jgi:hypothetical protein